MNEVWIASIWEDDHVPDIIVFGYKPSINELVDVFKNHFWHCYEGMEIETLERENSISVYYPDSSKSLECVKRQVRKSQINVLNV